MTDTLRECPFCGDEKPDQWVARYENVEPYGITCRTTYCGAIIRAKTRADATEAWNRRPARRPPSQEAAIAKPVVHLLPCEVLETYGSCPECPPAPEKPSVTQQTHESVDLLGKPSGEGA